MTIALLLAGLAIVAVGGAASGTRRAGTAGLWAQVAGATMLALGGFGALLTGADAGAAFTSELSPRFGVDGLTAFFVGALGLVAAPTVAFSTSYLGRGARDRLVSGLTAAFVLILTAAVCARDPLTFLAAWELMTLVPAVIVLVARNGTRSARRTVFTYIAITHLGGAGTWVAVLLLAHHGAMGPGAPLPTGSAAQIAVALAAVVGMGTKAGVMPFHVWLPRTHPIAPAPVSALMSGMMIKIAIYGLVRVLVEWVGVLPVWFGVIVLAVGALSSVGGVTYALFAHDLKRLLALHSIENVGIIVLGLGACLVLRASGASTWAAFALGAALLHTLNHAVFKSLLFLGAGAFEKAAGSLELDHLGGLLRRMPWTAGAFLVGAMAIAGLPPLNGFASEWLTLQSLLHVPADGGTGAGVAGAVALAALAATAALAVFCFVKVVGLVLLGAPRRAGVERAHDGAASGLVALIVLAAACIALGVAPGLIFAPLVGLAPWSAEPATHVGLHLPSTGSLPTGGIALWLLGLTATLVLLRSRRSAARAPTWACGQRVEPQLNWTSAGFTKPLRLVLESVLRPQREVVVISRANVVQEASYSGHVPHLIEDHLYRPASRTAIAARSARASSPERTARDLRRVPHRARRRPARSGEDRGDRVSAAAAATTVAQVSGGLLLAPLLPGLIQHWKARLQGRRGPSPLQPYRELRRLWGKSTVDVDGTSSVYRLAPAISAAALAVAVLIVPVTHEAHGLGVGHDALALAGLLAVARFAITAAAWDEANGFALMGASRDLTIGIFVEAALVLALADAALLSGSTDLTAVIAGSAGVDAWTTPVLALAAVAFALVVVAETGRQPVDNPDTHLELTMIHEGPLLEYAGRDLAYLQWTAAARHWIVLLLAAQVFLPHPVRWWAQLATLPVGARRALRGAGTERDPGRQDARPSRPPAARRRCAGCLARHRRLARGGRMSGGATWLLVALGLGVIVVRRRSIAVTLVTVQAIVIALSAIDAGVHDRRGRRCSRARRARRRPGRTAAAGRLAHAGAGARAPGRDSSRARRSGSRARARAALARPHGRPGLPHVRAGSRRPDRVRGGRHRNPAGDTAPGRRHRARRERPRARRHRVPRGVVARDRDRHHARPRADRARRDGLPREDLPRVRSRRHRCVGSAP